MKWHLHYEPAIHDPHRLKERFVARATNMKLYDELFSPAKIANYKSRNAAKYAADTAAYEAAFAEKKQLPPPQLESLAAAASFEPSRAKTSSSSAATAMLEDAASSNECMLLESDYETEDEAESSTATPVIASSRLLRFSKTTSNTARAEKAEAQNTQPKKKQKRQIN